MERTLETSAASEESPKTILSVDDQPANLRVLVDCLERQGHQVLVALGGEEAIQRAEFVRPDLILLDVHMRGIDGFETCRRLKANPITRDIPVIFMTVLADTADKLAGFAAGGVDYVTKPLDAAEVLARIETHLALSTLRRRLAQQNAELQQLAIERATRVKAEGESAGLRRVLEERDQMLAEREEMLRLLAHEVRQPLNNAAAALERAAAAITALGNGVKPDVQRPLLRAQHVLDHVIGTLNNTLAAATMLTSGATEAVADTDLDTLIGLVVHDIAIDDRPRLRIESLPTARTVQLQPVLMRLALCNLLVNALAYSPPDAPVSLRISESEDPLALVFEVADLGEGIPADLLPRLFDKGTRGRNVRDTAGAGLGLYIVRKVVELQHGRIDVLPNTPRGSIFRLAIPQGVEV